MNFSVSIYLKEKHTLNEQLAKLKELNSQMLFDLKNVDLTHKETIDRQERKISNLNKRIEYLQFKAFGTEGDDVEFY